MISQHRKCKFYIAALLAYTICLPQTILSSPPAPVDYLVPPSLPQALTAAAIRLKHLHPQNFQLLESRTIPKFANPPPPETPNDKQPSVLTRVARWFGFTNQNVVADQQAAAGTNKQSYYYPKPQHQQQHGDKENCYLCNKYPWVPMMLNSIQYPQTGNQWDASKQAQLNPYTQQFASYSNNGVGSPQQNAMQNPYRTTGSKTPPQIQHATSNLKQRAVKFNFPLPYIPPKINTNQDATNHIQYSTGPFLPIPIPPFLTNSALPPLYNAQNFHLPPNAAPIPNTVQELPSTEPAHFAENIAEHSEIHVNTIPTQIPPTVAYNDASFEIVKSHQLVDYVSSIEYPASYVPSHIFDVSTQAPLLSVDNQQTNIKVNTGLYQHSTFSPHLSQHVPASEILTEPGSFTIANKHQSIPQPDVYEQTALYNHQPSKFLESAPHYEDDNYAAASHQNSSVFDGHQQQQQQEKPTNLDAWSLESNDFIYATSTPEIISTIKDTSTITIEVDGSTQPLAQDNEIEFIASVQTNSQNKINAEINKLWPQKPKERETPKHLLDSPIKHLNGNLGAPRPFTRDPSELTFRISPPNHKMPETSPATSSFEPWKPQTTATESPIASSTFSSIDASGHYAGMSPPSLPSTYNSEQILLPHINTKNQPRPFEATRVNVVTNLPFSTSYSTQNVELHTPQESMLVKSHIKPEATTTTSTNKPRTTKYLTKILASNLRQLLQREHEPAKLKPNPNSVNIDINKLQKNIDDWTEQEYTSLSHRPSTPTIHGRSKNIPSEYLPSTTGTAKAARQSKTTKTFTDSSELPSSINNLEPLYERGSTKHFQYTQITDNHLRDLYNFESMKSKSSVELKAKIVTAAPTTTTTTTSTTTTTTTTEKTSYLKPIQIQEPEELWKKAKVSISPKTHEKVYVVTPQPRYFPQHFFASTLTTTTTTEKPPSSLSLASGFKSPRFLVRPTPGNDTLTKEIPKESTSSSHFTREWFDLRGLSAFVPSEPVEIIDGNSKVLNIVTPPSNLEKTTGHNIMDLTKDRLTASKRKTTMAPSPR